MLTNANPPHQCKASNLAAAPPLLSDAEFMFYSRQLLLPQWQERDQLRLKQAKVLVIGIGGLGCPVASMLSGLGIGELHLADPDVIALHNLPRQSLFNVADVGQNKAQVAAKHLAQRNPYISIIPHACTVDPTWLSQFNAATACDTATAFDAANSTAAGHYFDVIIELSDDQASKLAINRYCQRTGVAYAGASAVAHQGFSWCFAAPIAAPVSAPLSPPLSQTVPQALSQTELKDAALAAEPMPNQLSDQGCLYCLGFAAPVADLGCQRHGVFLPLLNQLASVLCQQLIALLLSPPASAAPIFQVQMPSHHQHPSVRSLTLRRDPHCQCCGTRAAEDTCHA